MKTLKRFPNYIIYREGLIFSRRKGGFLKPETSHKGYKRVVLVDNNGAIKKYSVHRLVAEAYIPNKNKKPFVCHIDSDPGNNYVDNLRWDDAMGNMRDRMGRGMYLDQKGENNYCSKLTEKEVIEIREILKTKTPYRIWKDGLFPNVSRSTFNDIRIRKSWKHL